MDNDTILDSASKTKRVVTIEEHTIVGGLGGIIAELLAKECTARLDMIGIEDQFAVVGDYGELLEYYSLTGEKLAGRIKKLVEK